MVVDSKEIMIMADLLANKTILVVDVANRRSIAWCCAQIMQEQGANLIYTYQNERLKKVYSSW